MKKHKVQKIIVPIDFSEMSIQAIESAKEIAQRSGAVIHLAHVHAPQYPGEFLGPILTNGSYVSFEEHRKEALGEELGTVARRSGLPAATPIRLREGASAFHEICRLARRLPADLIVMATHGRTGLPHILLGSTTERVVQHSPCPVLVTRARKKGKQRNTAKAPPEHRPTILAPTDFSDASLDAIGYAIEFAKSWDARLLVLHTIFLGDTSPRGGGLGVYRFSDFRQTARRDADREMQAFLHRADFRGVPFDTLIRIGKAAPEICAVATQRNVDLIITATHGRTGLKLLVMGSVAEKVVRHANRPVLVVPSHPGVRDKRLSQLVGSYRPARISKVRREPSVARLTKGVAQPYAISNSDARTYETRY